MAGTAVLSAPSAVAKSYGGANVAITLPSADVFAQGHNSTGERSLTYTASAPLVTAYGGGNAALSLGTPTLTISGAFTGWGTAAITTPSAVVAAGGTVAATAQAALTFGTTSDTYKVVGYSGAVASITLTGRPTVVATGQTGGIAGATLTLPLFDLVASGTVRTPSYANLLMPAAYLVPTARGYLMAPSAVLVAIGSAKVTATYEAYAVNLNHTPRRGVEPVDETTRYTNYPFERIVRYKNSYFGMNSTGLYLLEGTADLSTPIAWSVQTAETDFGSANKKTIEHVYFGGRLAPASTISLYAGEGAAQPYAYTTPRGELAQNYRQPFGRGIKSRYYALGVAGTGTLSIESVTMNVTTLARKI